MKNEKDGRAPAGPRAGADDAMALRRAGRRRALRQLGGLVPLGAALLGGCSTIDPILPDFLKSTPKVPTPPPIPPLPPTTLSGVVKAAERLNVGALQHSSPVELRIYLLKSTTVFDGADFLAIYERERETLGEELIERQEMVLQPGETKVLPPKTLTAETRAVGVVAAFQNLDRGTWRGTFRVRANVPNPVEIRLEDATVRIAAPAAPS